ncbi:MAG: Tm-1-like ATP-binding domain-containing protein [Truepera sp.]|nr:Tm-1-like ATP-binding domain-containing protein [Truepera sp.]
MGRIVVAGTFDTKAEPLNLLVGTLVAMGETPITIDVGVFGGEHSCQYPATAVAEAAGYSLEDVPPLGRATAVTVMSEGAGKILRECVEEGDVAALVCMGGSNAATVFAKLASVLPIGIPKILMATVVAGETRPFVNASDAILLYPIVDIEGNNSILRGMITRLAHVAVAALRSGRLQQSGDAERSVALTMFGVTTKCVSHCRSLLAAQGFESFVFHGNGSGGKSLESFVAQSLVSLVIDITISELTDDLFGGLWSAGPERLRTASERGVPQVIAPGAIDMIDFGPLSSVPERYRNRILHRHNDLATLVRTTPEENRRVGECVAKRLAQPTAPTAVLIPTQGFSALDVRGGPFFDPEAVGAFTEGLRAHLSPSVSLVEIDYHINDPEFAEALVAEAV